MTGKKVFVEPEIVKYEQSLDKVTLHGGGSCTGSYGNPETFQ